MEKEVKLMDQADQMLANFCSIATLKWAGIGWEELFTVAAVSQRFHPDVLQYSI